VASPHPDKLIDLNNQSIELYRKQDEPARQAGLFDATVSLGTLWGQLICDQLGWTWASIKVDGIGDVFGVVSPNRSHLIFPMHHMNVLLYDTALEQDSLKLYNELKAGKFPAAKEGAYTILGSAATA